MKIRWIETARRIVVAALGGALAALALPARADITVGVVLSATGAAASQGLPEQKLIALLPKTLAGEPVKYIVLDDATDPTAAGRNARRLTTEDKVDVLLGASTTPTTLAVAEIALESRTPQISMAPMAPRPDVQPWAFVIPQSADLMIDAVLEHMKANGVKTVGYIGYSNSWGDLVYQSLTSLAPKYGIKVLNDERYARTDTSATAQALKTIGFNPDAILFGATGTPAVLPHVAVIDKGYAGKLYHTHGVVNDDFLRVGGKQVEKAYAPIGPVVVYRDLADANPVKKVSADFVALWNSANAPGPVNAFATWAYDAYLMLQQGSTEALKKARPGTPEFRLALRNALEGSTAGLVGSNGIYNITKADHNGLDKRARVMVQVVDADWRLAK